MPKTSTNTQFPVDKIERLNSLFGVNAAFVPCHPKSKRPKLPDWQKTSSDWSQNLEYRAAIEACSNIAVLLGAASDHLATFDFDCEGRVEEFLHTNPRFKQTLQTKGKRGCNFWTILTESYPKSFDPKDSEGKSLFEFRADGRITMIEGIHPSGVEYRKLTEHTPIHIRWDEINWPEEWPEFPQMHFGKEDTATKAVEEDGSTEGGSTPYDEIAAEHGHPFIVTEKGTVTINQIALAEIFLTEYPLARYAEAFYHYLPEKGIWQEITPPSVRRVLGDYMAKWAGELKASDILPKRTDRFLREMIGHLEGRAKELTSRRRQGCLVFSNGVLDLDNPEELLPFSHEYGALNRIEHRYDPNAVCASFLYFLSIAVSKDDILLLQKWGGMALSGKNFAQSILLLVGAAGAGKGTFVDVLSQIIGDANIAQLRTRHLENSRFEVIRFSGKTLLIGADVKTNFLSLQGAAMLKSLTGGDTVDGERKGVDGSIRLKGNFNILATSNGSLQLRPDGDEDAWGRRLKIVPFKQRAKGHIPNLSDELIREEASGIINWLLEGLRLLKEDYAKEGKWMLTGEQQERIDAMIAESSSVRSFVLHELTEQEGKDVTGFELYSAYQTYCERKGWEPRAQPLFAQDVADVLRERFGLRPRHDISRGGAAQRGYRGIQLNSMMEEPPYVAGEF